MMNTRTTERRSRQGFGGALGRVLLCTIVGTAGLGAIAERAEAQTVIIENGRPVSLPHTLSEMTVVETADDTGPGAGPALMAGGALLLTAGWVSSFAVGLHEGPDLFITDAQLNRERQWYEDFRLTSFIPVAGPWIALSQKNTDFTDDFWGVWLVANGLLQAAGLTMFVGGVIASAAHDMRSSRRIARVRTVSEGELSLIPSASPQQVSLTMSGHF
jgi:hypothetical protein